MKKILIIAPFGMTLRQIILNDKFWKYLNDNFEIHIKSPVEIDNYSDLGISKTFNFKPVNILEKVGLKICSYFFHNIKNYTDVEFFVKNNLGEHLVQRIIRETKKDIIINRYSIYSFLKPIEKLMYILLELVCQKVTRVSSENYSFLLITHISEFISNIEAISANQKKTPVITYTLGMDNYRHGKLLFNPSLMLLWGKEHEYEFKGWHQDKYPAMKNVNYKIAGNLAHDFYIKNIKKQLVTDYIFEKKNKSFSGYIVVPAMLEHNIPGQTIMVEKLISYVKIRSLDILIIVRILPGADIDMWKNFENKYFENVLIQEPMGASFDKRGAKNNFNLQQEKFDASFFSSLLAGAELILNLYPSTVTIDGYLMGTPSILPLFSWHDLNTIDEHPYAKIVLAKILTHPLNKQHNIVYNLSELHNELDKILTHKKRGSFVGKELFNFVCEYSKKKTSWSKSS
jgi:hypothetical protein